MPRIPVFWNVMPYSLAGTYHCFEWTTSLLL